LNHFSASLRITVHDAATYAREIQNIVRQQRVQPKRFEAKPPSLQNATVEYLNHLVHENAQCTELNADAEWLRFLKTVLSHRFLNKRPTSAAWAARLFSLSGTRSFSPEWSHTQYFPFRTHTTLSYAIVLNGLLRKRAYSLALEIWERIRKHGTRKLRLDAVALGVGVEVLIRSGHPERALALIETPPARDATSYAPRANHNSRRPSLRASWAWHVKCLISRELIFAQILSATAGADHSRVAREAQQQQQQQQDRTIKRCNSPGTPNWSIENNGNSPVELTTEEQLLGALLEANGALLSVLRDYDDIERIDIERDTLERSQRKIV